MYTTKMNYGIYLSVAALLTGFCAWMSISKLKLSEKFVCLILAIGLFVTVAVGMMQ